MKPKEFLSKINSVLHLQEPPSGYQRLEFIEALDNSLFWPESFLSVPAPKTSDRKLVESGEVSIYSFPESIGCRLPDDPDEYPIFLSKRDVQIALRLSDELHLNEIDCVRLILTANEEVDFDDADEILHLATHLWYTERRDLLAALNTLLWAAAPCEFNLTSTSPKMIRACRKVSKILINKGLRQRLISLIKELQREEQALTGRPHSDVPASNCVRELRKDMVTQERLTLGHCLVLSVLVTQPSKHVYALKLQYCLELMK